MKRSAVLFCLFVLFSGHIPQETPRPNIVLIMADDMGIGDAGVYNPDSKIPTPHIGRLAAEGMRFTDVHTPSAVCTPTRYGLLTGRYAWRTRLKNGVLWGRSPSLIDTTRITLASLLQQQGYATAGFGKWHLGLGDQEETNYARPLRPGPLSLGFDTYFGIPASLDMDPYVYFEDDHVVELPTDSTAGSSRRRGGGGGFWRAGPQAPDFRHIDVLPRTAERAVAYIEERAETPDEPFFVYVPLSAPHTPWLPTPEYDGRSQAGPYGDFTAQVDGVVGQILGTLDQAGFAENTLVIFTSDNGADWIPDEIEQYEHDANLHFRGRKADIWEAGHRVPFIVRWPGQVEAGSTSDEVLGLTDVFATLADLVQAEVPSDAGEDSFSMLPVLLDEPYDAPIRPSIVHHSLHGMFAVRQGSWKLIEGLGSGGFTEPQTVEPGPDDPPGQLYNLDDDPSETTNLYLEHPDIVARLTAELDRIRS